MPLRTPALSEEMKVAYGAFPPAVRRRLKQVRKLVFKVADECDVGQLDETLKWGQPAYLPVKPRTGSTLRLGSSADGRMWILYVHCQTTLASTFRAWFPDWHYEGNRAVHFSVDKELDEAALASCIEQVLTYHRRNARQKTA